MRMLWWILGASLKDKKRNEVMRKALGVACITEEMREARLRWRSHVMRRENENSMKRIMTAGPLLWNCLPVKTRAQILSSSLSSTPRLLKSFLFLGLIALEGASDYFLLRVAPYINM